MTQKLISAAIAAFFAMSTAQPAAAEWVPEHPITIIIPFGAGGSTDIFGRVIAAEMANQTGWTVVIENRPGASGVIGQMAVMDAAPDGYTIGMSSTSLFAMQPFMDEGSAGMTSDKIDFLATSSVIPYAIVAASDAPFDDLKGLADYTKAHGPAKFSSTSDQLTEAMKVMADGMGIEFLAAQTSGSGESLQLVAGRHADITLSGGVHVPYVLDGRMKVIAHFMDERGSYAPDALTVEEQGGELPLRNYFLFNAPLGLPPEIRQTLATALDNAITSDAVKAHGDAIYVTILNLGPEGTLKDVEEQAARWRAHFGK